MGLGYGGGHVNPAVTLGLASVCKIKWYKIFHYFAAQYLGAFLGAAVTYGVYHEAITNTFGAELQTIGVNGTAGIFGTFSNENISTSTAVIDQIVATAFFLLVINAITDEKNMACPKGLIPIAIGITDLGLLIFAFGYNCGAPINPARDFAPRVFTALAGWGNEVFTAHDYYFWVPLVCCHIGGVLGSWIYRLFIELHWPEASYELAPTQPDESEQVFYKIINATRRSKSQVEPL
ncbi:water-specific aquaporin-like protein [Dinothrombium tinctorium]|uniref:Water-specific aquaporin-like protein n=1 Tax=Dinothrombium tinctorium TaxID=1965070 RepID=A0A443RBB0_9ACAR|nr:water-specific aquaporin-like protein [Dinothrombium tinctorium]